MRKYISLDGLLFIYIPRLTILCRIMVPSYCFLAIHAVSGVHGGSRTHKIMVLSHTHMPILLHEHILTHYCLRQYEKFSSNIVDFLRRCSKSSFGSGGEGELSLPRSQRDVLTFYTTTGIIEYFYSGRKCRIRTATLAPRASVLPLHHILYNIGFLFSRVNTKNYPSGTGNRI